MADAIRAGYHFNLPLRTVSPGADVGPLVRLDNDAVVVEAVKAADDRSGDVVLRCYESLGGQATVTFTFGFPVRSASVTDLLERTLNELTVQDGAVTMQLRPFEVVTLRVSR